MTSDMMEGYPLSPQQERVWLLQQGEPGMPYRAQCAIHIEGPLDLQVFTTAMQQVVERHEMLRTTFHGVPGMTLPVQVIGHPRPPEWPAGDWCGSSSQDRAARLAALWHEACQRPFDFAHGPLLQLCLTRLAPMQHRLLIRLPALCADMTTLMNLVHDLSRAYAACVHGETLSDTPLQYVDFAAWQSNLLTAEAGEADRAYWRKQLMADLLHVKLPGEQPPSGIGFTPGVLPVTLPPPLVAQIDALVQQYHTSHAVFFLACWTLLLWRHLGQADTLVGMAYDGRNYEPLQGALGLFARYLPIRCCALEAHESFSGLLERLYTATQEAYHRQEYFAWDDSGGQSDTGPAFFPLCFEFVEQPVASVSAGVSFAIEQLDVCTERFKVKLGCVYTDGALSAALHYDAQAFQSEMIASLAEQLQTLLASASQHPEEMLGQLELLSDTERQRVLVTFNQTQAPEPHNLCLHRLFEAQATRTPDRIAAVYADQYLTYAALNARANQLAHHLQQLGVAPQVRVGICLEGSLEMLVGIFGILKAGGAYVPLDPTYPRERLAFMATDAQAPVLLTQARLLEEVAEHGVEAVCLDTEWEAIARHSEANPVSEVTCGHLAYVIYTSGSTGQPKGVLVTHGNVVHSTQARLTYYQPVPAFLLLSSFAFDSSVAGLFGTLCQGGTLILPGAGYQGDLGHLTTLITRHHVSHVLSLPSLYALLLQQASPSQLDSLRAVIVAGEACPRGLVTQHDERLPGAALFNEYGPTEGTVWSSVYPCQLQDVATSVPIGRPIANTQIYLLNTQLQPVPIGIPGELYIGGAGVTIGYCNRAALTAERFLPHPFSEVAGARLYKTGDLGRYRPDGTIEFLGRSDQQVKIRGFRIELGEIETVLHEHPAIAEAVVVAPSPQRLVAYLVAAQNPPPSPSELRRFLQAKLPDYMVPSFFVWLEALPLAPNGKVDRQALPDVETLRTGLDATYVAPATEVERTLAMIWQEVLHVEKVGIHDNFFDLGGHSLAMVHVHSKLQETYRSDLSLVDLFRYPTISALVSYVSQQEHEPFATGQSDARAEMRRGSIRRQRQLRQERRNAARAKGSA
jgi:amino acid adenylation domain-containing protein